MPSRTRLGKTSGPASAAGGHTLSANVAETRRLNLNIPATLHSRIKAHCALQGRDMTDALIELLKDRYPEDLLPGSARRR